MSLLKFIFHALNCLNSFFVFSLMVLLTSLALFTSSLTVTAVSVESFLLSAFYVSSIPESLFFVAESTIAFAAWSIYLSIYLLSLYC